MIPPLKFGVLPEGTWECTLDEFRDAFATDAHRLSLLAALAQFIESKTELPHVPLFVDGSFVTDKPTPKDIDVCADLDALPPAERALWERVFYAERWYLEKKGIDFWIRSPDFPEDVTQTEFPRIKAVDAERLNLPKDARKGFLKIP